MSNTQQTAPIQKLWFDSHPITQQEGTAYVAIVNPNKAESVYFNANYYKHSTFLQEIIQPLPDANPHDFYSMGYSQKMSPVTIDKTLTSWKLAKTEQRFERLKQIGEVIGKVIVVNDISNGMKSWQRVDEEICHILYMIAVMRVTKQYSQSPKLTIDVDGYEKAYDSKPRAGVHVSLDNIVFSQQRRSDIAVLGNLGSHDNGYGYGYGYHVYIKDLPQIIANYAKEKATIQKIYNEAQSLLIEYLYQFDATYYVPANGICWDIVFKDQELAFRALRNYSKFKSLAIKANSDRPQPLLLAQCYNLAEILVHNRIPVPYAFFDELFRAELKARGLKEDNEEYDSRYGFAKNKKDIEDKGEIIDELQHPQGNGQRSYVYGQANFLAVAFLGGYIPLISKDDRLTYNYRKDTSNKQKGRVYLGGMPTANEEKIGALRNILFGISTQSSYSDQNKYVYEDLVKIYDLERKQLAEVCTETPLVNSYNTEYYSKFDSIKALQETSVQDVNRIDRVIAPILQKTFKNTKNYLIGSKNKTYYKQEDLYLAINDNHELYKEDDQVFRFGVYWNPKQTVVDDRNTHGRLSGFSPYHDFTASRRWIHNIFVPDPLRFHWLADDPNHELVSHTLFEELYERDAKGNYALDALPKLSQIYADISSSIEKVHTHVVKKYFVEDWQKGTEGLIDNPDDENIIAVCRFIDGEQAQEIRNMLVNTFILSTLLINAQWQGKVEGIPFPTVEKIVQKAKQMNENIAYAYNYLNTKVLLENVDKIVTKINNHSSVKVKKQALGDKGLAIVKADANAE